MANALRIETDRRPEDLFIVLTGNLHNRLIEGRFQPMGYFLRLQSPDPEINSLNITYGGGTAWVCTPDGCGVQRLGGEEGIAEGVDLYPPSPEKAYSGRLHVARITASRPARDR